MSIVSLPPGKYAIYPATSATSFSGSLAVAAPNAANQVLSVQTFGKPLAAEQQWIITGDGYLTTLGTNNFLASADEGNMKVKSGLFGTGNIPTKFLINVTVQTTIPGLTIPGYTGTIRTPDSSLYYWNYNGSGTSVELSPVATTGTVWAFAPIA